MSDQIFFYCFVFFLPGLMIVMGSIFLFKKDWAWAITERLLSSVLPQRTFQWERSATARGIILLVGGILIILYILFKLK